ncbi:MAG: GNAT family N-acetyltransferase [Tannerellaceae bacterium]
MLTIEFVTKSRLNIIQELANEIFPHTYKDILSQEQIEYMTKLMYSIQSLQNQIEIEKQIFHLIKVDNIPCGYFSLEQISPNTCILQKLYLHPSQQGKGLGKQVMKEIISYIKSNLSDVEKLKLYVNRKNKAKYFYLSFGFSIIESRDFNIGNNYYMNDYIMELSL